MEERAGWCRSVKTRRGHSEYELANRQPGKLWANGQASGVAKRTMLSGVIRESRVVAELSRYREEVCTSYKFMQRTPHHTVVEAAIT